MRHVSVPVCGHRVVETEHGVAGGGTGEHSLGNEVAESVVYAPVFVEGDEAVAFVVVVAD